MLEAQATVEVAKVIVDRCTVTAPWDGVMATHLAEAQESVGQGSELVAILAAEGEEIDLIVPSAWLAWLAPGQPFDFDVDELGSTHAAEVERDRRAGRSGQPDRPGSPAALPRRPPV